MPKEITHWTLAEMACRRMEGTRLGKILETHRETYLLGAVMYDTPFYAPETVEGQAVAAQGKLVHGTPPNNTMLPFVRLAEAFDAGESPSLLAFIAGAASHMIADTVFHPFVEYFAGSDISRHYRLESLLDCHFFQKGHLKIPPLVSEHLAAAEHKKGNVLSWMALFFDIPPELAPALELTLNRHGRIQQLFEKRWARILVSLLAQIRPKKFTHIKSLFYPSGISCPAPFFHAAFTFRHPVTCEEHRSSIEDLTETTLRKICSLFTDIDEKSASNQLATLFSAMPSLSLVTGMDPFLAEDPTCRDTSRSIDELVHRKIVGTADDIDS